MLFKKKAAHPEGLGAHGAPLLLALRLAHSSLDQQLSYVGFS